jgi:hypothetical protein
VDQKQNEIGGGDKGELWRGEFNCDIL